MYKGKSPDSDLSFNSQRDGILRKAEYQDYRVRDSFNSQRDGILQNIHPETTELYKFQFPTGWNSTIINSRMLLHSFVSIPNGMEFYAVSVWVSVINISFNSQRDGILRFWNLSGSYVFKMFQFPTGWNSTGVFAINQSKFTEFQFPTGWNSTGRKNYFRHSEIVSIPNGMEFY